MRRSSGFFDDLDLVHDVTEGLADHHRSVDSDHGRVEIRDCYASEEIDWLKPLVADWHGVKSIAMVTAKRWIAGKESSQTRYYISSLKAGWDDEYLEKLLFAPDSDFPPASK